MIKIHDKCICCFNAGAKVVIPRRANIIFCCIFTNNVATTTRFRDKKGEAVKKLSQTNKKKRREERGKRKEITQCTMHNAQCTIIFQQRIKRIFN